MKSEPAGVGIFAFARAGKVLGVRSRKLGVALFAVVVCSISTLAKPASSPSQPPQVQPPASSCQPPQAQNAVHPAFDIEAFDVDGNTLLDQETIETAVYPFLGPQRSREDVDGARGALQKAYLARGYQSVVVEVPPQSARAGIVKLHIVEAPVGRLRVVGSNYSSLDAIKEQVPSIQEGKVPDFNQAQKEVAELNRLPDRQVSPLIKPGKVPGTVDIDLKVNDNLPVHGSLEVNNDHAQNTTPVRTTATVSYANLWQLGHTLSLTALVAPKNLGDAQVYSGSYMAPIWGTPWSILLYGYDSNSDVATLGGLDVLGKGYAIGLRGILQLPSWKDIGQSLNLGIDFKHFLENEMFAGVNAPPPVIDDYFPLAASYTLQAADEMSSATLGLAVTMGLRGPGSSQAAFENKRASARANFVHVNIDTSVTADAGEFGQLGLRFAEQLADGPLVSSEEFSAGGFTSVRGYLQSEALADDGVLASVEIRSPSFSPWVNSLTDEPIFDEWRTYGFTDGAVAWVLDPLPEQTSKFRIGSFGLGTRFRALGHLTSDFLVAVPMRDGTATRAWLPYFQFSVKSEL